MAEADAEYSAFYQVNGTNISCKPIQVKGLVSFLEHKVSFFCDIFSTIFGRVYRVQILTQHLLQILIFLRWWLNTFINNACEKKIK